MKSAKKSILKTVAKVGAKSAERRSNLVVRLQRNPNAAAHISVPL